MDSNNLKKYSIKPRYYYDELACKRARAIRILDLFKHNEEGTINDKDYEKVVSAGRNWYKNDDVFVVGNIDNKLIDEIKGGRS